MQLLSSYIPHSMAAITKRLVAAESAASSDARNEVAHGKLKEYAEVLDFSNLSITGNAAHQSTGTPYANLVAHFKDLPQSSNNFRPQTIKNSERR